MKKKFGDKAKVILEQEKKITGLHDFLRDDPDEIKESKAGEGDRENKPERKSELRNTEITGKQTANAEEQIIVRHELHLDEELSEKVRAFQFFNKEKNKTRFFKIVLNDFFSKSDEQQKRIYKKWLKNLAN